MGSHYRERHQTPVANTTTADLAGLTGTQPNQLTDDLTKTELLELAAQRGLDVKPGMNKAELRLAIANADNDF